jgi:hypothetical protein
MALEKFLKKWQLQDQLGVLASKIPKSVVLKEVQMLLKEMS